MKASNAEIKSGVIKIERVLEDCFHCLQQIVQWQEMHAYDKCAEAQGGAEALLDLMEHWFCGSCGGFAPGQDSNQARRGGGIYYRWKFLADHYDWKPKKDYEKQWLLEIAVFFKREDD